MLVFLTTAMLSQNVLHGPTIGILKHKKKVVVRIRGVVAEMLVKTAPEVYLPCVTRDRHGLYKLLVICNNAIYGTMMADGRPSLL